MSKAFGAFSAWLVQRLSAVFMLAFIAFVLVQFASDRPQSYAAWREWVFHPGVSIASVVFVAALLIHAWVGLRDVALDYVRPVAARIAALSLLCAALVAAGAWAVRILLLPPS